MHPDMICIECTHPVKSLYTQYSDTNIRSTVCPSCNKFADKYIEHDQVNIAIDMVLLKPQAFRHMVFNVLSVGDSDQLHPQTRRIWVLTTLFDVYLVWATVEKTPNKSPMDNYILSLGALHQYLYFIFQCVCHSAVIHMTTRALARYWLGWTRPNALSTALLMSSASKLFPILMLIWSYDVPIASKVVAWAVIIHEVEALRTVLNCGYIRAAVMIAIAESLSFGLCDYWLPTLHGALEQKLLWP